MYIVTFFKKARESLAQYIARAPISLEKLKYEPFHGKILFKTPKYNDYFKENFRSFDVLDFIALATAQSRKLVKNTETYIPVFVACKGIL